MSSHGTVHEIAGSVHEKTLVALGERTNPRFQVLSVSGESWPPVMLERGLREVRSLRECSLEASLGPELTPMLPSFRTLRGAKRWLSG